ncbi:MAG: hypothetical protein R3F60_17190 [bacterium]
MARRALTVVLGLALGGCIADPHAAADDDPDRGVDAGRATDASADAEGSLDAAPDAAARACTVTTTRWPTGGFGLPEPFVGGDEVLIHQPGPDGRPRAVRVEDGRRWAARWTSWWTPKAPPGC